MQDEITYFSTKAYADCLDFRRNQGPLPLEKVFVLVELFLVHKRIQGIIFSVPSASVFMQSGTIMSLNGCKLDQFMKKYQKLVFETNFIGHYANKDYVFSFYKL